MSINVDKKLVQSVFLQVSQNFPHNIAITEPNRQISYAELNQWVNQTAAKLIILGIKKGDVVGLLISASMEYVVAMLAVLKVGGIFLPIEPETPRKRLGGCPRIRFTINSLADNRKIFSYTKSCQN